VLNSWATPVLLAARPGTQWEALRRGGTATSPPVSGRGGGAAHPGTCGAEADGKKREPRSETKHEGRQSRWCVDVETACGDTGEGRTGRLYVQNDGGRHNGTDRKRRGVPGGMPWARRRVVPGAGPCARRGRRCPPPSIHWVARVARRAGLPTSPRTAGREEDVGPLCAAAYTLRHGRRTGLGAAWAAGGGVRAGTQNLAPRQAPARARHRRQEYKNAPALRRNRFRGPKERGRSAR
jgi:hypothetical protein